MTFKELNLKDGILSAIEELGYEQPMPVQEQVIPFMLTQSADLVALAQTGTGKTAAFWRCDSGSRCCKIEQN